MSNANIALRRGIDDIAGSRIRGRTFAAWSRIESRPYINAQNKAADAS
jgi:hypothetical protein